MPLWPKHTHTTEFKWNGLRLLLSYCVMNVTFNFRTCTPSNLAYCELPYEKGRIKGTVTHGPSVLKLLPEEKANAIVWKVSSHHMTCVTNTDGDLCPSSAWSWGQHPTRKSQTLWRTKWNKLSEVKKGLWNWWRSRSKRPQVYLT